MAVNFTAGKFSADNDAGAPLVGGLLYTYASGTTTPKATYTSATLGTANTNPIVLDARGEAAVWLGSGAYTMVLKTSAGVTIWTQDGIQDNGLASQISVDDGQSGSLFTVLQGFISYLASSFGSSFIGFLQAGAGAVQRSLQDKGRDTVSSKDFGAVGDGSDETSKVQTALNSISSRGGDVSNPPGVKFNIKSLTFPAKSNLIYRADDDLSAPGPGFDIGSGEWVNFSVNSSYPAQPSGGAVNEWRFSAPFHPGIVVDARKDITGGNSGLAPGQTLNEPVRASVNLFDEQTDAGRLIYEHYLSGSNFSMLKLHTWRRVITLNGIGTAQWASVPAEGTLVTGTTSGAKGFLLSVDTGATTLLWFSGKFVSGETVSDNNETTSATITSVVYAVSSMAPLAQGLKRGNWAIGLPADAVRDAFVVGGKIGTQKDRSPTFYVDEQITAPGFVWVDSYENATPSGYEIVYDTVPAAASRRLTLRRYNGIADIGHVGAIAGHCTVADSGTAGFRAGGFNFATVARGGSTGRYDFTFTAALTTANYRVILSSQFTGHLSFDLKTTTGFSVFVYNATGSSQWAPSDFDILVIGGDL